MSPGPVLTFRKTTATRVHAVLSLVVLGAFLLDVALTPGAPLLTRIVLGGLTALALLFVGSAFGDRCTLTGEALVFHNRLLAAVGLRRARTLMLSDIASVREHRARTLFIRDRGGRRFVIDAVADYVELRDRVLHAHRAAAGGDAGAVTGGGS